MVSGSDFQLLLFMADDVLLSKGRVRGKGDCSSSSQRLVGYDQTDSRLKWQGVKDKGNEEVSNAGMPTEQFCSLSIGIAAAVGKGES